MAQSAPKERALLGFEPFWERPFLDPPLTWERLRFSLKLALLANEGVSFDLLREATPDKVSLPLEPIYEDDVANSTAHSERDPRIQNEQFKNAWLNKCQKIEAEGILYGDRRWKLCDSKTVSLTYLILGTEDRRIFGSHEPTLQIYQISPKDLWDSLDNVYTKQRNITFDRYTFFTQKQLKGEPVEKLYGFLRELSLNWDPGIYNPRRLQCQYERRGDTTGIVKWDKDKIKKTLELAINIEMGIQNQLKISGTAAITASNQIVNASIKSIQNSWNRPKQTIHNFKPTIYPICRYAWSSGHC